MALSRILLLLAALCSSAEAWSSGLPGTPAPVSSPAADGAATSKTANFLNRRSMLSSAAMFVAAAATTAPPAHAVLDVDAFVQKELAQDKPSSGLSEDEALCRFGQPSQKTGEACVRAGMSTKLRKGGVDAFGKVESRGDYVRCKAKYVEDPQTKKLVKEWNCA